MGQIKEFFINLDRCVDKRLSMEQKFPNAYRIRAIDGNQETPESILPYVSERNWRDPCYNRRMTKGEVGCVLSHIKVWEACVARGEGVIVHEDDAVVINPDYMSLVDQYKDSYDFLYLSRKHISGEVIHLDSLLETSGFCYWTLSYYITPKVAKALLCYFEHKPLIPADEIIPAIIDTHRWGNLNQGYNFKAAAFKDNLIYPMDGAFDISETESLTNIWEDYMLHVLTVGTNVNKTAKLTDDNRYNITNLGAGVEWQGGNMALGPGGGQKINLIKEYLKTLNLNDVVMFLDGYDTFIHSDPEVIMQRYLEFGKEIVFSAEKTCWPDTSLEEHFPQPQNGYRFLNSGTFIGTVKELRSMFEKPILNHEDDQLYAQKQFITGKYDAVLDHESYIFFCMSKSEQYARLENGWLINGETRCTSCVAHGNGSEDTKRAFEELYIKCKGGLRDTFHPSYQVKNVGNEISQIKGLIPKDWCERLINACEEDGGWHSLPSDKFPGQEIRLNTLNDQSFIEEFREFFANTLSPVAEAAWPCLKMYGMRDCFVIKYSSDSQTALPLHHDMSLVSFACKLRDDFEGGELNFPRQNVNNGNWAPGELIMWPGQVTHPHESLAMKSGIKYGLVVWSSRDSGDTEYYEQ